MVQIRKILTKNNVKHTDKISSDKQSNYGKSIDTYSDYIQADLIMIMTNPNHCCLVLF